MRCSALNISARSTDADVTVGQTSVGGGPAGGCSAQGQASGLRGGPGGLRLRRVCMFFVVVVRRTRALAGVGRTRAAVVVVVECQACPARIDAERADGYD